MTWIDFREVREKVRIVDVLAKYNVRLQETKDYLRGPCPLPTHTRKGEQTFSAHKEKNLWACASNSCKRDGKKGGNVIDFVAVMEACTIREAALKLAEWFGLVEAPKEVLRVEEKVAEPLPELVLVEPEEQVPLAGPLPDTLPERVGWCKAQEAWIGDCLFRRDKEDEATWLRRASATIKANLITSFNNGRLYGKLGK